MKPQYFIDTPMITRCPDVRHDQTMLAAGGTWHMMMGKKKKKKRPPPPATFIGVHKVDASPYFYQLSVFFITPFLGSKRYLLRLLSCIVQVLVGALYHCIDPNCSINCWIHFFFKGTIDRYRLQENDLQVGTRCHGGTSCIGTW